MIACNAKINFGMPALVGRRLTVYDIVTKLYYEESVEIAISDYRISLNDAKDALKYCRELCCKEDKNLIHFCDGCVLRMFAEGSDFDRTDFDELVINGQNLTISKDNKIYFAGTLQELEDSMFGKVTWLMAEEMYKKL